MRSISFRYIGILLAVFLVCLLVTNSTASTDWGVITGDWASWTSTSTDSNGRISKHEEYVGIEVVSVNSDGTLTLEMKQSGYTMGTAIWSATGISGFAPLVVAINELEMRAQQNNGFDFGSTAPYVSTSAVSKADYQYIGQMNGKYVDKTMNAYTCTYSGKTVRGFDCTGELWWDQNTGLLYEWNYDVPNSEEEYSLTLEDTNASLSEKPGGDGCSITMTIVTIPIVGLVVLELKKRKMK